MFHAIESIIQKYWPFKSVIPNSIRFHPLTAYIGHRMYQYFPFLLPHDPSYLGLKHVAEKKNGLILDIGANDGISALGFRKIIPWYSILSIEPNRHMEPYLAKLKKRIRRFDYMIAAAGRRSGTTTLFIPYVGSLPVPTAASLHPSFVSEIMKHYEARDTSGRVLYKKENVRIIRLDDLGVKPSIVKLDTEGHDADVLTGLKKTISKTRPYIVMEYHPTLFSAEHTILSPLGYRYFLYDHQKDTFSRFSEPNEKLLYREREVFVNIFCIPKEFMNKIPVSSENSSRSPLRTQHTT